MFLVVSHRIFLSVSFRKNSAFGPGPDFMTLSDSFAVFFYSKSFANANVLLVLGELMGGEGEDGGASQAAIPLIAGAIVLAQVTMVRTVDNIED